MGNIYSGANNNVERKRPVSASAVVRIVIWSVVFCLLTGLFALAMFREIFGHGGISLGFGGYYYDDDGFSIGNGTTERTITELNIDWVAGDVTVAGGLTASRSCTSATLPCRLTAAYAMRASCRRSDSATSSSSSRGKKAPRDRPTSARSACSSSASMPSPV